MKNSTAPSILLLLFQQISLLGPRGFAASILPSQRYGMFRSLEQHAIRPVKHGPFLPVVLWHGLGDSCCNPQSIGAVKEAIERRLPGVLVYSISTGSSDNESSDKWSSFFGNVNQQVEKVCGELRTLEGLEAGYNAIGFSQGGQFLRAVVQRCQHLGPKMRTLVTMGGQHQGVSAAPGCGDGSFCERTRFLIDFGAYIGWIQSSVVPAQYYKDRGDIEKYLEASIFLADINNERAEKNRTYADNLMELEKLVLVRFTKDETVVPRDTSWFSWWNEDGTGIVPMRETPLYKGDWIGLRSLDEAGRVELLDCEGEHMQFTLAWLMENIVDRYLSGTASVPPN